MVHVNTFSKVNNADIICACGISREPVERKRYVWGNGIRKIVTVSETDSELKKYGTKPRLGTNAIKLYLVMNHLVDSRGFCPCVSYEELLSMFPDGHKPCMKTLKKNIELLDLGEYISYGKIDSEHIAFGICDFSAMFLPAREGGNGYHIFDISSLNYFLELGRVALVLALRTLISIDQEKNMEQDEKNLQYQDMRRWLPLYCKRNVISRVVTTSLQKIFSFDVDDKSITFSVKEDCQSRQVRRGHREEVEKELLEFFRHFREEKARYINTNGYRDSYLAVVDYGSFGKKSYDVSLKTLFDKSEIYNNEGERVIIDPTSGFDSNDKALSGAVSMAAKYSVDAFKSAFYKFYELFCCKDGAKGRNPGALVNTFLQEAAVDSYYRKAELSGASAL